MNIWELPFVHYHTQRAELFYHIKIKSSKELLLFLVNRQNVDMSSLATSFALLSLPHHWSYGSLKEANAGGLLLVSVLLCMLHWKNPSSSTHIEKNKLEIKDNTKYNPNEILMEKWWWYVIVFHINAMSYCFTCQGKLMMLSNSQYFCD